MNTLLLLAPKVHRSSILFWRMIGSMFMRVNSKCAHQVRPPLRAVRRGTHCLRRKVCCSPTDNTTSSDRHSSTRFLEAAKRVDFAFDGCVSLKDERG
jgi:hypothetical protein